MKIDLKYSPLQTGGKRAVCHLILTLTGIHTDHFILYSGEAGAVMT